MSLLHLVHKNVVLKFSEPAKPYNADATYAFRLTGVDGMGFLQIQELSLTGDAAPETASEAFWINKDVVREIHEYDLIKDKSKLTYTGKAAPAPTPAVIDPVARDIAPKLPKAKKSVLKSKPVFN